MSTQSLRPLLRTTFRSLGQQLGAHPDSSTLQLHHLQSHWRTHATPARHPAAQGFEGAWKAASKSKLGQAKKLAMQARGVDSRWQKRWQQTFQLLQRDFKDFDQLERGAITPQQYAERCQSNQDDLAALLERQHGHTLGPWKGSCAFLMKSLGHAILLFGHGAAPKITSASKTLQLTAIHAPPQLWKIFNPTQLAIPEPCTDDVVRELTAFVPHLMYTSIGYMLIHPKFEQANAAFAVTKPYDPPLPLWYAATLGGQTDIAEQWFHSASTMLRRGVEVMRQNNVHRAATILSAEGRRLCEMHGVDAALTQQWFNTMERRATAEQGASSTDYIAYTGEFLKKCSAHIVSLDDIKGNLRILLELTEAHNTPQHTTSRFIVACAARRTLWQSPRASDADKQWIDALTLQSYHAMERQLHPGMRQLASPEDAQAQAQTQQAETAQAMLQFLHGSHVALTPDSISHITLGYQNFLTHHEIAAFDFSQL